MPVAHLSQGCLFVHSGLLPEWAELGLDGLDALAREEWRDGGGGLWTLPRNGLFRGVDSPLWDRSLVQGGGAARRKLLRSLQLLGAERMIIGHTQTASLRGGQAGRVQLVAGGKLVAVDVGLKSGEDTPRGALIIEECRGYEWTPARTRLLWR